ncbi:Uma2 family endonuclease [Streptomyces sp. NPDC048057]|uniref:Uma2 family endonuclease n=1 Tax=Streptomyces sp. NPDC048057 TaxID=3155628 RepID=UPI003405AC76
MTAKATDYSKHRQPDGSSWPMPPKGGYTMDDLFALDLPPHTELIDGSLVFVSPQRDFHTMVLFVLERGMHQHIPEDLRVRREMAIVIGPRNVPEPDLIVLKASAITGRRKTRYDVADVVLAVEVVSPDSEDRDRDTKPHKYAGARVPYFWRVEMGEEDELPVVHTFARDDSTGAYLSTGVFRDRLKLAEPFEIDIDLTEIDRL